MSDDHFVIRVLENSMSSIVVVVWQATPQVVQFWQETPHCGLPVLFIFLPNCVNSSLFSPPLFLFVINYLDTEYIFKISPCHFSRSSFSICYSLLVFFRVFLATKLLYFSPCSFMTTFLDYLLFILRLFYICLRHLEYRLLVNEKN